MNIIEAIDFYFGGEDKSDEDIKQQVRVLEDILDYAITMLPKQKRLQLIKLVKLLTIRIEMNIEA